MKELSIEEKAKAYDKALERMKSWAKGEHPEYFTEAQKAAEFVFPELKESEDERIRKALINGFNKLDKSAVWYNGITNAQIIAWLEKQGEHKKFRDSIQIGDDVTRNQDGVLVNLSQLKRVAKKDEKQDEQKLANNVEPKFHEGDWVMLGKNHNGVYQVERIDNYRYYLRHYLGGTLSLRSDNEIMRLWTIQDAQDGDVLATLDYVLIFKKFLKNDGGISYCHYDFGAENPQFIWFEDEDWYFGKEAIVYPATKEQRDLLFQKMKEAGYEWDAEEKELKKVDSTNIPENFEKYVEHLLSLSDGEGHGSPAKLKEVSAKLLKLAKLEQKPAWSEEDERMYKELHNLIYSTPYCDSRKELSNWLKLLIERYTWKPSDEQLRELHCVISGCSFETPILVQLAEDLKKLMEKQLWLK